MHTKKVFVELKRRKQVENLAVFEKNKIAFNFLHVIEKIDFLVVIQGKKKSCG
jgi:hypothetical protein